MANETEKTILPYLNVLEVETIDKSNVTKVIVIDKDDEVKVMDGSQLDTNSYFDLQDKPEINSIELNGNMTSEELGLASSEDIVTINSELEQIKSTIPSAENIDNQITERLADYPTKEEVTTEISDAVANKADKSEIPTKTSQLTNDSGFISSLDGYATEKWVEDNYLTKEATESALNSKQNKLNQGDGIVIEENTISADYNTIRNKPSLNGTELSGAASIVPAINIQSVPSKVTLAPVFGNQTGEAVELPIYNTETNQAGIVNGPLYAQLADKYTKAEIDALNTAINKEIATKQDLLVSGTNIKTINSQSLLGEGNIVIDSGSNIPHLFITSRTQLSGNFAAVKNAIVNKRPFGLYYVNILGYDDVAAPEVCFVSGEIIQATFHFESSTANHTVVRTTITPTGVSAETSYHRYQEQLVSGTNIKTINGESILGEGNLEISGSGGTTDYTQLTNKPQINSVELSGNKSLSDLGIQPAGNYIEAGTGTQPQINTITVLTQSEYDGLSTKDPNTQYLIVE